MKTRSCQRGLSLVETAIALSVMMMITAVLAPAGANLIQQARDVQVERDCASLRNAVIRLLIDNNQTQLHVQPTSDRLVSLLVSSGVAPEAGAAAAAPWTQAPDSSGRIDLIENYLIDNAPAGDPSNAWPAPLRADGPGWRGTYLAQTPTNDPWGHRYAINVQYLNTKNDVVVVSAGPDGIIDTPYTARGVVAGGDDRYALVR
jgi:type II secretory pathway pseudopilin PulG